MYKVLAIVVLFCSIQSVFAASDPYIQTVKEMYKLGKKSEEGMQVIELHSDASLKQAFNLNARNGEVCGFTDNLLQVFTKGSDDLLGKFIDIKITAASRTSLKGVVVS